MSKQQQIVPDQGWSWLVLVAAFFCNLTFDGIIFSFGIFYLELLDYFNAGHGATSWIGSVISGVYAIIGPIASVLANKFGCRIVTMVGALIAALGFVLSTFSPNITMMIFTYGIMGGFGFGLMYLCAYVMIGYFFERYRALATGVASCGSGVGTFIFAPLTSALIDYYGWKGSMWILAGFVLNGVVCGALFRPIPRPAPAPGDDPERPPEPLLDWRLLTNPAFVVFCMSSFLCLLGFFVPFMYVPDYARKLGVGKSEAAYLLSIIGVTNTIGRIACGYLSDKPWADALKIYNAALILGGSATMLCSMLTSYWMLCIYAAIFGLAVAAYVSLCAIILVEFLGLEKLSNSFGFLNMFRGIATFIGAPVAGMLYDATGEYDLAFYTAGAFIATSGIICLPLRVFHKCDGGATASAIAQYEKEISVKASEAEFSKQMGSRVSTLRGEETAAPASRSSFHGSQASFRGVNGGEDDKKSFAGSNLSLYKKGVLTLETSKAAFSDSMENVRSRADHGGSMLKGERDGEERLLEDVKVDESGQ